MAITAIVSFRICTLVTWILEQGLLGSELVPKLEFPMFLVFSFNTCYL